MLMPWTLFTNLCASRQSGGPWLAIDFAARSSKVTGTGAPEGQRSGQSSAGA